MRFRDIIGQESVKQQLRLSVQKNRIPHAQLLCGPSGIGKLQLAIAYAQYIACQNRSEQDSCGVCPACLQYQNLQHPDLHFVYPIVKTDSADVCDDFAEQWRSIIIDKGYFSLEDWYAALGASTKQGMIYEKESEEILRKLSLKSFGNGYKVMIIWQPEKMNIACANKLLKLLEEPPQQTLFLLVSEHPEELLPTILSRLQRIVVPRLEEERLATLFAPDIAHIANGSYLAAQQITDLADENNQYFTDFVALMRRAWLVGVKQDYKALQELRQWSNDMADAKVGRERQKAFLQYTQKQVRENFIYNLHQPAMNYQTAEETDFSTKFAPFINAANVEPIMNELDKAERQIAQNGNAKMIFFDLCLQMIVLIKKK
ncbi:MAG: DNA polymerase III subunit delta [Paludibacteraceae bacterium]|nr:DNA polymerase III subunit delta [Paludibacteraceae bacterium]